MACRIEIRKTINESIDKVLPYRFEELGKAGAEKKAKDLNDLWGPLARPVRASSDTFQVEIYNIDNAVEKEFEKQTQAEQAFSRDLNFFNDDQALYEQDKKDLENQDVIPPVEVEHIQVTSNISQTMKLRDGKTYSINNINVDMLEDMGYGPNEIGNMLTKIRKEIC